MTVNWLASWSSSQWIARRRCGHSRRWRRASGWAWRCWAAATTKRQVASVQPASWKSQKARRGHHALGI